MSVVALKSEVAESIITTREALKQDPEMYFAYQSNIAMAMYDVARENDCSWDNQTLLHVCNAGAKRFLDLWIQ